MRKLLFVFIVAFQFLLLSNFALAQGDGERYRINGEVIHSSVKINPDFFIPELLEKAILDEINKMRIKNYLEPLEMHEITYKAAQDQATYMAKIEQEIIEQKDKEKRTTAHRLQFFGGSNKGTEIIEKTPVNKRGEYFSYYRTAYNIVFKWFAGSKTEKILLSNTYIFAGIGNAIDELGNNVYVSLVLGNYETLNEGIKLKSKLQIPISEKSFGIIAYDERECKKLTKYNNLTDLQTGIYVEDGKVYWEHDDFRLIKKLFRNKKDGVMVDLVQKEQYTCSEVNIIDNSLINKGVLLSRLYTKKLLKGNLIEGEKSKSYKTILATIPEQVKNDFELNLILIQNKHACRTLTKSFTIGGNERYSRKVELLADSITINSEFDYEPQVDTSYLSFHIPFEKRKFTYKTKDIKPLIDSLKEPAFQIHELIISAYSSVEGTKKENEMLQQKRAESIINAIKKLQDEDIISSIETGDNWDQFKKDILQTEFQSLASMSLEDAQKYLNSINLDQKLEHILAKHRYAQVDMKITYNLDGINEQKFVISEFNKAITYSDLPLALSIQKFIFRKVMNGKYNSDAVFNQNIPAQYDFAGLLMNKIWLEKHITKNNLQEYEERINNLYELNSDNDYIKYNYVYLQILYKEFLDERKIREIQSLVDELYTSTFTKETVDALNIKLQLEIINSLNRDEFKKTIQASLNRLKTIIDVRDENAGNALKLAYLFIEFDDYDYAYHLLDPFVMKAEAGENFIFTYLSLCSKQKERTYSNRFLNALEKANYLNHDRFCDLFNGNYFSFQVFDNLKAKEFYCKECEKIAID